MKTIGKGKNDLLDDNQRKNNYAGYGKIGKGYFTVDELADRWRLHRNTILNYIKNGLLNIFKPPGGRIILIPIEEVINYEQNQLSNKKEIDRCIKENRKALTARKVHRRAG